MAEYKSIARMDATAACELCAKIFVGAGVSPEHAAVIADCLIAADLRGHGSHGISRMMVYCERLDSKLVNTAPKLTFIRETDSAMVMDADNAPGPIAGIAAMDKVIEKAKKHGMASCAVCNANHYGIAAYYGMRALEHDMIGISFASASSAMAAWGGKNPFFGTNPVCFTAPALTRQPFVLDMATSIVARGKVLLADIEGKDIPEGWALDPDGNPTVKTKPALAGTLFPFGGYKGYGVAMMVDILCALLSGSMFGPHIGNVYNNPDKQNLGQFFCAIDIGAFAPVTDFKTRMDQMIDEIKSGEKAPGVDEIFYPGEIESNNEKVNREYGFEVGPGVMRDLADLCKRYGLGLDPSNCLKD